MADHVYYSMQSEEASEQKRKRTGYACAVGECSMRNSDGVSMHSFPKDPSLSRIWVNFVRTCRADFTPTTNSRVCSLHFTTDCYPVSYQLKKDVGMAPKCKTLVATAVPTIQKHDRSKPTTKAAKKLKLNSVRAASSTSTTSTTATTTAVGAVKHQPLVTSTAVSTTTSTLTTTSAVTTTATVTTTTTMASTRTTASIRAPLKCVIETSQKDLGVTVVRAAYAKRESKRALDAAIGECQTEMGTGDTVQEPILQEDCYIDPQFEADTTSLQQPETSGMGAKKMVQKSVQVKNKRVWVKESYFVRHKGTQSPAPYLGACDVSIQCNMNLESQQTKSTVREDRVASSEAEPSSEVDMDLPSDGLCPFDDDVADPDYQPQTDGEETDDEGKQDLLGIQQRKFLVFEEQLKELFSNCPQCAAPALSELNQTVGSLVRIRQECSRSSCGFKRTWSSQPLLRNLPAGNLLMSAAILFSGSLPSKALLFLRHLGVKSISDDTFFDHQRAFLHPAIEKVWSAFQADYIEHAQDRGQKLCLGGDGRADSPGHSAKFGSYTMMDLDSMQVVDVRTVQSNEAGNSNLMEKAGFLLSLEYFQDNNLDIGEFVSDRHTQIMKYVREQTSIKHSIDVWHVAKGLKKKLTGLSKEKECELLSQWIRSIVNHLYWIPVTSPDSDEMSPEEMEKNKELKLAKWTSLGNHLHNKHEHSASAFPVCQHEPLVGRERKKKWLKPGTKLSVKLGELLDKKRLLKDITMLSTGPQTAAAESFHATVNRFAPKMIGFHYEGIAHRIILAALDFNENSNREQAIRRDGVKRFHFSFRKGKKGFTLQEVKVQRTYMYVKALLEWVTNYAANFSLAEMEQLAKTRAEQQVHLPLCSTYQKPNKEEAAAMVLTRYKKSS